MKRRTHWLIAALILTFAAANAKAQEYTNPQDILKDEKLKQDFLIQGEYIIVTPQGEKGGLHLIADGGGKFRAVIYEGGLPGNGWKTGDLRIFGTAEVKGVVTEDKDGEFIITITGGSGLPDNQGAKVTHELKGKISFFVKDGFINEQENYRLTRVNITFGEKVYQKQYRQSPTHGEKPPEGAIVLFDGKNVDQFERGAKMNESPGGNTLWAEAVTKPLEKKPYKLHIEFMTSYMPQARGQARSNSGVYLDDRYECQILDSFGLELKNDECGGFYGVAAPKINMCYPPLTWQTYDIDFTPAQYDGDKKIANAKVSVKHNGVLIHENLVLPKETGGRKAEGSAPLGVYLQGHGNKVQYRNIWVKYE
jgi:hypothetical protein